MRLNSRKPASKIASRPLGAAAALGGAGIELATVRAPDQKRSSKRSASRSARSSTRFLRKMITHDATEANSSSSITSCTGMLACSTSCSRSRPLPPARRRRRRRPASRVRGLRGRVLGQGFDGGRPAVRQHGIMRRAHAVVSTSAFNSSYNGCGNRHAVGSPTPSAPRPAPRRRAAARRRGGSPARAPGWRAGIRAARP